MRGGEFDGGLSAYLRGALTDAAAEERGTLSHNDSQGGELSCDLANVCAFGELVVGIFV